MYLIIFKTIYFYNIYLKRGYISASFSRAIIFYYFRQATYHKPGVIIPPGTKPSTAIKELGFTARDFSKFTM